MVLKVYKPSVLLSACFAAVEILGFHLSGHAPSFASSATRLTIFPKIWGRLNHIGLLKIGKTRRKGTSLSLSFYRICLIYQNSCSPSDISFSFQTRSQNMVLSHQSSALALEVTLSLTSCINYFDRHICTLNLSPSLYNSDKTLFFFFKMNT